MTSTFMYSREFEEMHPEELKQLQLEKLQALLNRICRNVAFYRESFEQYKIDPAEVRSLENLKKLPFTTKEDLLASYPYGMFAVPLKDVVRIHSTSGTTGKPIITGYTKNDLAVWSSLIARILTACGVTDNDFLQVSFNYNLTTGAFGFHAGAERIGCSVIPASREDVKNQIMVMRDYKTTVLASTPGFALHMAAILQEENIHPGELSLKTGILGAEPWSEKMRSKIETRLGITAYDNYGLTEIIGPGVSFECRERNGLHVNEDHFIIEVIDPETGEQLPDGDEGELVFTTLTRHANPLLRYRTGDICRIIPGECPCGRTFRRMARVSGRNDDMIIVEGVNVFPSQVENSLLAVEGIRPHYRIVLHRERGIDVMEVQVEVAKSVFSDEGRGLEKTRESIRNELRTRLGITPKITLVEPKKLASSKAEKMMPVVDLRNET